MSTETPLVEVRDVDMQYGALMALQAVSASVYAGQVTCVLGDNGAGKSTFIKILAGAHQPTRGELLIDGTPTRLANPRDALQRGISTVFQDLATIPLMPIWRNFFLGAELTRGRGPLKRLDIERMRSTARDELAALGVELDSVDQPIGTLSGGQRQCVAIARAIHFGARVLILDEPTAALGVRQSAIVLKQIRVARDRGLGVVFISHNPHHAHLVGDRFLILRRGRSQRDVPAAEITVEELTSLMAGGAELEQLSREL